MDMRLKAVLFFLLLVVICFVVGFYSHFLCSAFMLGWREAEWLLSGCK